MKLEAKEDRCSGCRTCELVCSMRHFSQPNPKRSAVRVSGAFPVPGKYSIILCDQCGACAEVCPVEAIRKVGDRWEIDPDLCTGCLLCVEECPEKAMFSHPADAVPWKCVLCGECVAYCPRQAIVDEDGEAVWAGVAAKKRAQSSGR